MFGAFCLVWAILCLDGSSIRQADCFKLEIKYVDLGQN